MFNSSAVPAAVLYFSPVFFVYNYPPFPQKTVLPTVKLTRTRRNWQHVLCLNIVKREMESGHEYRSKKKARKRKTKDVNSTEEEVLSNGVVTREFSQFGMSAVWWSSQLNLCIVFIRFAFFPLDDSSSDVVSAIQNICTCFGVGGLYNPKKRYVH